MRFTFLQQINIAQITILQYCWPINHHSTIVQLKLNQSKCWFLMRGEKPKYPGENLSEKSREIITKKCSTHMTSHAEIECDKCSHDQANPDSNLNQDNDCMLIVTMQKQKEPDFTVLYSCQDCLDIKVVTKSRRETYEAFAAPTRVQNYKLRHTRTFNEPRCKTNRAKNSFIMASYYHYYYQILDTTICCKFSLTEYEIQLYVLQCILIKYLSPSIYLSIC